MIKFERVLALRVDDSEIPNMLYGQDIDCIWLWLSFARTFFTAAFIKLSKCVFDFLAKKNHMPQFH